MIDKLEPEEKQNWKEVQKLSFRFLFLFIIFMCNPWNLLMEIPGLQLLSESLLSIESWIVHLFNNYVLTINEELVPINGSGDTSYAWSRLACFLFLTVLLGTLWSFFDRNRSNYIQLDFLLTVLVRYTLVLYAFSYGIIKLFAMQMPFPQDSLLATPIGDLLPMRLSWVFFGFGSNYQIFGGVVELLAATLLLFRRTVLLGSLISLAVFSQVWVLNLTFDIPVKLFSGQLMLLSAYLVWLGRKPLSAFSFRNTIVPARLETVPFAYWNKLKHWRIGLKLLFMLFYCGFSTAQVYLFSKEKNAKPEFFPGGNGFYSLEMKILGNDTVKSIDAKTDTWAEMIIHPDGGGSLLPIDTNLRIAYGRTYFGYEADSIKHMVFFKKRASDSLSVHQFTYTLPSPKQLILTSQQDSNRMELHFRKTVRHFQLTEKQFHWLSEANR